MANHVFIFDAVDKRFIVRPGTFVTRGAGKKVRIRNFSSGPVRIASASPNWTFGPSRSQTRTKSWNLASELALRGSTRYEVHDRQKGPAEGNSSPSIVIDDQE